LNLHRPIEFLLDSGASRTTILDNDAVKLGINYSKLGKFEKGTTGIGGVEDSYILPEVRLIFRTTEGLYEEHMKEVFVLKHEVKDRETEERIKRIPSLLGRDFLDKYIVIFHRRTRTVVISDEKQGRHIINLV